MFDEFRYGSYSRHAFVGNGKLMNITSSHFIQVVALFFNFHDELHGIDSQFGNVRTWFNVHAMMIMVFLVKGMNCIEDNIPDTFIQRFLV